LSKLYVDELHPKTSGGAVKIPNKISFLAVGAAGAYATTSPVIPATVKYNYGNGYSSSTGRFTVPSGGAGLYWFHAHFGIVQTTSTSGSCYPRMNFYNAAGSAIYQPYTYWNHPDSASYGSCPITAIFDLAVGDYVYLTFAQTNAQYYNSASELSFQGYLIG
tara:strand:+ start:1402 stop:1887 length:486 start_codon:yes stop_codon:yes gene_type:complete